MSARRPKFAAAFTAKDLGLENERLRFKVQQLEEKIRSERKRANQLEEELAFVRQQQVYQARQRLNGEFR